MHSESLDMGVKADKASKACNVTNYSQGRP